MKMKVPTIAGKTNTRPIKVWLFGRLLDSSANFFFIFILYYKGKGQKEKGKRNVLLNFLSPYPKKKTRRCTT